MDPQTPVSGETTLEKVLDDSVAASRSSMTLMTLFAATALGLVLVGVFGVLSHGVQLRTREMGIRLALGAKPSSVRRLILGQGLAQVGAGAVLGAIGAWMLTSAIQSLLFGVTSHDPMSFAAAIAALLVCAVIACDIPARRATHTDPGVLFK
jgi:ABC-type antimicrobial peptide transport system permease subunit